MIDAGWPREALLITVVRDRKGGRNFFGASKRILSGFRLQRFPPNGRSHVCEMVHNATYECRHRFGHPTVQANASCLCTR